jgi:uncharacterized membrane protein
LKTIAVSKTANSMAKSNRRNQKTPSPANARPSAIAVKTEQSFSGPLPPPQILDHYNQIVPGAAEKIIALWESQVQHRQELEKKAITSDITQAYFGAILGFIIAMSAIGAGTFLAYIGRPTEGIAAIISALVGLVGVYGWGSYQRRKERDARINQ